MEDKKKNWKPIAAWAALIIAAACLVITGLSFMYGQTRQNALLRHGYEVLRTTEEVNYSLVEGMEAVRLSAFVIGEMMDRGSSQTEIKSYLENQSRSYQKAIDNNFSGLYGLFRGEYLDGVGWTPKVGDDYDPKSRPWYIEAMKAEGEVALVTPYVDTQTGLVMMSISKLLKDRESVISMDVALDGIQQLIENTAYDNSWESGMILDPDGFVVAHSDASQVGRNYSSQEERGSLGYQIISRIPNAKDSHFVVNYDGRPHFVFFGKVGGEWYSVIVLDGIKVMKTSYEGYVAAFFVLMLLILAAAFLIKRAEDRKNVIPTRELYQEIRAMRGIYFLFYSINLINDTFIDLTASDAKKDIGRPKNGAQVAVRAAMDSMTDERYKKNIYDFINFDTLRDRLREKNTISKEFINNKNRRCRVRFAPAHYSGDKSLATVMWMVEVIEEG